MTDATQARINMLEETLAHQEMTINDLSDELAKQWHTIERMGRKMAELEEKLAAQSPPPADAPGTGEPPPPHY